MAHDASRCDDAGCNASRCDDAGCDASHCDDAGCDASNKLVREMWFVMMLVAGRLYLYLILL